MSGSTFATGSQTVKTKCDLTKTKQTNKNPKHVNMSLLRSVNAEKHTDELMEGVISPAPIVAVSYSL